MKCEVSVHGFLSFPLIYSHMVCGKFRQRSFYRAQAIEVLSRLSHKAHCHAWVALGDSLRRVLHFGATPKHCISFDSLYAILRKTAVAGDNNAIVQERRAYDETVGGILVDFRQRR